MSTLKIHGRCVNTSSCPVIEASKVVGDFWNLWILRVLMTGPKRFSLLEMEIPTINKTTLNNKLKTLITDGVVTKTFDADLKPQSELTKIGKKLKSILFELETFGRENF